MPQVQEKGKFLGYGIVYPEGTSRGLKVVNAWTDGGKKIRHSDGSVEFLQPMPSILELFGGAFCYASGDTINKREHLEPLPDGMRERALAWYDKKTLVIPKDAIVDIPEPAKKGEPEPNWIRSDERKDLLDLEEQRVNKAQEVASEISPIEKSLSAIMGTLEGIAAIVKSQGEEIAKLKTTPPVPAIKTGHKKQSEMMKARWADPEYRNRMRKRGKKDDGPEANQEV